MPYSYIFGILETDFSFFCWKMTYCDSHIHLSECRAFPSLPRGEKYLCVSSCRSREDFEFLSGASAAERRPGYPRFRAPALHSSAPLQNGFAAAPIPCALASFGIHPQDVCPSYIKKSLETDIAYLESLLSGHKIAAVGECGLDFFTPEGKSTAAEQEIVFERQLALAKKHSVPLVLHLRKSIDKAFSYSGALKGLRAVVFHSFPGTLNEALSLLRRGINAFFSFGKPVLNGKKSALDCVSGLPAGRLLFETDAPYQALRGEDVTRPDDIKRVYAGACELRRVALEELCASVEENFLRAFYF